MGERCCKAIGSGFFRPIERKKCHHHADRSQARPRHCRARRDARPLPLVRNSQLNQWTINFAIVARIVYLKDTMAIFATAFKFIKSLIFLVLLVWFTLFMTGLAVNISARTFHGTIKLAKNAYNYYSEWNQSRDPAVNVAADTSYVAPPNPSLAFCDMLFRAHYDFQKQRNRKPILSPHEWANKYPSSPDFTNCLTYIDNGDLTFPPKAE